MDSICDDIIISINKCIQNDEYHNYKFYRNIMNTFYDKKKLYECNNFIELNEKLKKININVDVINFKYSKQYNSFAFNIFYNKYEKRVSICL